LAVPHLEDAARLNPNDAQATLSLGRAYAMQGRGDRAAESYLRATALTPNDGNAWLALGTAYLQQVEEDARIMTSTYGDSTYFKLRAAEVFSEQGKLVQAEDAFRSAIASPTAAPCRHAEFGIVLLRKKKVAEAREQYGLGQHQTGFLNLRDIPVRLLQANSDIAIPFVISSKGYGLLWNNPSLTDLIRRRRRFTWTKMARGRFKPVGRENTDSCWAAMEGTSCASQSTERRSLI
jgi:tetratricopeptide (TPR) repeat protein